MRFDHYANLAAELGARLVNAADLVDAAERHEALREVVGSIGRAVDLPAADLAAVEDLARTLRGVFHAPDRMACVNEALADVPVAPRVTTHDDRGPHLHFDPPGASVVERLRANTLLGLAAVICDERDRLGVCEAHGCEVVFVDTSRNARRRFCSDTCANRFHVAAHRARRRAG